ncbi:uncharacterized protein TNCV_3639501 [Trichonephila clavipes]|nr:uncharacterized protein TNCV_3639501 [Trichonephila clavipes]
MILTFTVSEFPPLQLIDYATIAQGTLYTFDLEFLKRRFMVLGTQCTYLISDEYSKGFGVVLRRYSIRLLQTSDTPGKSDQEKHLNLLYEIKAIRGYSFRIGFGKGNWF